MRRVILESPYGNDDAAVIAENVKFALRCAMDCLQRDESPIASHLVFPLFLDDKKPEERALGIAAGLAWVRVADAMVVYMDRGMSEGMKRAIKCAEGVGVRVEMRTLSKNIKGTPDTETSDDRWRALHIDSLIVLTKAALEMKPDSKVQRDILKFLLEQRERA